MKTINADPQFLIDVLDLLVANIFKPSVINRHQLLSVNAESFEELVIKQYYENSLNNLVNDLSKLVGSPDIMVQRFNRESTMIQIALYERFRYITDNLNDSKPTTYTVPADLPGLFLWFFNQWSIRN